MKKLTVALCVCCAALLFTGCAKGFYGSGYGPVVKNGLKDPSQVAPEAQAFAAGKMSLDQALATPEARADRGASIVSAIKDLPPARAR